MTTSNVFFQECFGVQIVSQVRFLFHLGIRSVSGDLRERQLLMEAGAELACIGCNMQSLNFFGLKWMQMREFKGVVDQLGHLGLPMMIAPSGETIEKNDHLCSSIFVRPTHCPQRRLVLSFDRTYLETSLQLFRSSDGPCFAGGSMMEDYHRLPGQLKSRSKIGIDTNDGC